MRKYVIIFTGAIAGSVFGVSLIFAANSAVAPTECKSIISARNAAFSALGKKIDPMVKARRDGATEDDPKMASEADTAAKNAMDLVFEADWYGCR